MGGVFSFVQLVEHSHVERALVLEMMDGEEKQDPEKRFQVVKYIVRLAHFFEMQN